jgi:hypothetical protein
MYQKLAADPGARGVWLLSAKEVTSQLCGGPGAYCHDILLMHYDFSGQITFARQLGGTRNDIPRAMVVDGARNVFIVGLTSSSDLPLVNPTRRGLFGRTDGFVAKFESAANEFTFVTYFGGSADDDASSISSDRDGNFYILGSTSSLDFPKRDSLEKQWTEGSIYLMKLDATVRDVIYSTGMPQMFDAAADSNGVVHLIGSSHNLLPTPGAAQTQPTPRPPDDFGLDRANDVEAMVLRIIPDARPANTFSRVEQDSSFVVRTGTWHKNGSTHALHSQKTAMLSVETRASASVTFEGTAIEWITTVDPWAGIARLYLDGQFQREVDTYSSSTQYRVRGFAAEGLPPGTHTLRIEVTGRRNPASRGSWVWIDAFEVAGSVAATPPPPSSTTFTRVEQSDPAVIRTGTWSSHAAPMHSGGSAILSMSAGARATFSFRGTAIRWIGLKDAWAGIANVYIDGILKATIDTYSAAGESRAVLFTLEDLSTGSHTIAIEATGTRSSTSRGAWVWLDSFEFK